MGGSLLLCDFCDKSFHLGCHIPPLDSVPFGDFKCCECRAPTLEKLFHCGNCQFCLRDDCGSCLSCRDKPKFGGEGTLKQMCELKQCPNKRYAPPAIVSPAKKKTSVTSSTKSKSNPSTIERNGAQTADNTADESEDDIPNDLILCQRELKRSREEIKKQSEEIKRLKGALQAMIA